MTKTFNPRGHMSRRYEANHEKNMTNQSYIPIAKLVQQFTPGQGLYDTTEGEILNDDVLAREDITRNPDFDLTDSLAIKKQLKTTLDKQREAIKKAKKDSELVLNSSAKQVAMQPASANPPLNENEKADIEVVLDGKKTMVTKTQLQKLSENLGN
nr:MAG: hypothetical protein [Microviridae sp.]